MLQGAPTARFDVSSVGSIDPTRVYSCGYSNGAFFTYALACYHSDKIDAKGSVAGTMMEETYANCSPSHPMSMINIHGTSDFVVVDGGHVWFDISYQGSNTSRLIWDFVSRYDVDGLR